MGKSKKKRNEEYEMIEGTLFQFFTDLEDCDGYYSEIIVTDAGPVILDQIASDLRKDKKLSPREQKEAVLNILKTRGYKAEPVERKVITIQSLK